MSEDAPEEPAPPPRKSRRRAYVLAGAGAALAIAVTIVAILTIAPTRRGGSPVTGGSGDGGLFVGPRPDPLRLPRDDKKGTGSEELDGLVVDGKGAPVDGAQIVATAESGSDEEVVAHAGADGAFTLLGLHPGRYRVRVEGDEIFTAELRYVAVPSDGLRIAVARRVDVVGTVVDGGRPVPGAIVTIDGDGLTGRRETTTDADGKFSFGDLPEGGYRVWAHESDLAARAVRVPRLGAGPFPPVTLTLEPATIVVGRVVDRATKVGVEAAISIEPAADSIEAARYARTGPDGVFRVEGVPHGRWLVDAYASGWLSTGAIEVEAGRGIPEIEMTAGGIVEGRVVDGMGRAVTGASVVALGQGALGRGIEVSAAVGADQLRRFSGFAPSGGTRDPLALASSDFTADPQFVPRGELGVMLGPIPFPPPPGVTGVKQAAIVPEPEPGTGTGTGTGAAAPVAPLPADPAYAATFITDADGRFRITGLDAATWQVVATAPDMAAGRSAPVVLELGKVVTGIEIVLSPGTFVMGTVTSTRGGALVGATVTAEPKGGAIRDRIVAITGPDGTYRLGPLLGDVVLTASTWGHADGRAELALAAPTGDHADELVRDFALDPADAMLRGRVLDPDRLPVRGAQIAVEVGPASGRHGAADDSGWFEIAAVPAGEATVRVEHPDFPPQRFPINTARDAELAMVWGGKLEGVVFDHHTGEPLAGIAVSLTGPGGTIDLATGQDGDLASGALLAGPYLVRVRIPGYLPVEKSVDVPAGKRSGEVTARDVRIELERGALLAGVVRDRFGKRLSGATVVVAREGGGTIDGKTDSEGQFRFVDAPTGEVIVRVKKGGLAGSKAITLRPGDEVLSFTIDVE